MKFGLSNSLALGRDLAKVSRMQNAVYPGLLAALTCYLMTSRISSSIFCYLYFLVIYAVSATHNNLSDIKTDKLNNRRDNPIAFGAVTKKIAKIHIVVHLILFVILQIFLKQPASALIGIAVLVLSYIYSGKPDVKSKGWWSILLLSTCYGVVPLALGMSQGGDIKFGVLIKMSLLQILLIYPVLLAKDYKDLKGDKQTNKLTPLIKYGSRSVYRSAVCIALLACCLALWMGSSWLILMLPFYLISIHFIHKKRGEISPLFKKGLLIMVLVIGLFVLTGLLDKPLRF